MYTATEGFIVPSKNRKHLNRNYCSEQTPESLYNVVGYCILGDQLFKEQCR